MVAAVSAKPHQNPTRPPLLPSDHDNASLVRRPKSREVTSRYLSISSSSTSSSSSSSSSTASAKRCASPSVSRTGLSMTPAPAAVKRSQSVERRRAVTPRPDSMDLRTVKRNGNGELSAAQKLLLTSTRSLSVSFQGESFSYQVSKAKPAPTPIVTRKATPDRRKVATPGRVGDRIENSKPERWPARLQQPNSISRSVDYTDERNKLVGSGGSNVVRALHSSMIDNRVSANSRLNANLTISVLRKGGEISMKRDGSDGQCGHINSDADDASSPSVSEAQECVSNANGVSCGKMVQVKLWPETNHTVARQAGPGSPVAKKIAPTKFTAPKKFGFDSPASSPKGVLNSRGLSPIRSAVRPSSPSKLRPTTPSTPSRGVSPSKARNDVLSGLSGCFVNMPSIPSFGADTKRGKFGEDKIYYAHMLRLLHNRMLQWRFVNAQSDAALSIQRRNAEKSIYNAWISTSKLRESVKMKRAELQLLRQNLKLASILKGQIICLDEWAVLDQDFSSSLTGATEALRASTLRLPVVGGARVDVQKLKNAICSVVDVMQAMASSICPLASQVSESNSLVAEIATLRVKECALLDQCRDFSSTVAVLQVKEWSLRTHTLQLKHTPPPLTTEV